MSAHSLRHLTWKYHHPNAQPRAMQNPQSWIGKVIPADIDPESINMHFCECDRCNKAFANIHDLQGLMSPEWNQRWAWELLRGLGYDAAEMFCDDCYAELDRQAEKIIPNWHHYYVEGYVELPQENTTPESDYVEQWLGEPLAKAFDRLPAAACEAQDAPSITQSITNTNICSDCNDMGYYWNPQGGYELWCESCNPKLAHAQKVEHFPFTMLINTGDVEAMRALIWNNADALLEHPHDYSWMIS